jgi:hypothetical protein
MKAFGNSGNGYPRIQILSIRELPEENTKAMLPLPLLPTYKQAERITDRKGAEQRESFG